jgi:tetratricopeptide (TPR) repeat protein
MRVLPVLVVGVVLLAAPLVGASPGKEDLNSLFNEACDLYEASEFEGALGIFESLISNGVEDPIVYYNLGNCYYQLGDIGKAVVDYRRAAILAPRDQDVEANLDFVRSSVGFRDTTGALDPSRLAALPGRIASPHEWRVLGYAAYYAAALCFLGVLFLTGSRRKTAIRVLIVLLVLAAAGHLFAVRGLASLSNSKEGAVVVDRSEFMSGPGAAFDELTRLPDGVELTVTGRSGIWLEVRLATGEVGWLREENIETI